MDFRLTQKELLFKIDALEEDLARKLASSNTSSCAHTRSMVIPSKDIPIDRNYSNAAQSCIGMLFAVITCPLGFLIGAYLAFETAVIWWHSIF